MRQGRWWMVLLLVGMPLLLLLAGGIWAQGGEPNEIPLGFTGTSHSTHFSLAYDQTTHELVGTAVNLAPEGSAPFDAVMHPNQQEVWMAGFTGDGVVILDAHTHDVIDRIPAVGDTPVDIEFSKDGSVAYVSNRNSANVVVIDATTYQILDSFPLISNVDSNPWGGKMTLNPCTGELYMVNYFDGELWRVDPEARGITEEIGLGSTLWNPMVDPQAERLYVTDRELRGDKVHVLDISGPTFVPLTAVPVADDPWGIDITPNGRLLVIANEDDNNVQLIDTESLTVTKTITLTVPNSSDAPEPRDVEVSQNGRFAYVPSNDVGFANDDDAVLIIDLETGEQVDAISVGAVRKPVVVSVAPPHPSLDPIPSFAVAETVVINSAVAFTDSSGNAPTAWAWDFGDGVGTATEQNPVYSYANPGIYTITLTATNRCGSQTTTMTLEVLEGWPTYLPFVKKQPES